MPKPKPKPLAKRIGLSAEEVDKLKSQSVIGAWMLDNEDGLTDGEVMSKQRLMQTLYESRLASLQRLVSFFVMFHQMGKLVQDFWPTVSFGLLGYDMSRTQSIMRVASTASPVSGSEVRRRVVALAREQVAAWSARQIMMAMRLRIRLRRMQRDPKRMSKPAISEGRPPVLKIPSPLLQSQGSKNRTKV